MDRSGAGNRAEHWGVCPWTGDSLSRSFGHDHFRYGAEHISGFIKTQTEKLGGKVPAAQNDARDALIGAVVSGEPSPSAKFADAYTRALNDALIPLADDPSMPTRLNMAIVVGRIAEHAQSLRLKPVVVKLLGDKCDPVVLWAVKATKALLPAQLRLRAAGDDPLLVAHGAGGAGQPRGPGDADGI